MRLEAIIEEPEQNLFPLAQKSMLEYLVRGINDNGDLCYLQRIAHIFFHLSIILFSQGKIVIRLESMT